MSLLKRNYFLFNVYFDVDFFFVMDSKLWEYLVIKIVFSGEHHVEEHKAEQQNTQPMAKIGTKKQRKLEEKQARKAQREVTRQRHDLMSLFFTFWPFFVLQIVF